jgi:lipoprotein-anchoring transpeptidase ErfK/SrfK
MGGGARTSSVVVRVVVVLAVAVAMVGCGSGRAAAPSGPGAPAAAPLAARPARVSTIPATGAVDVDPASPVSVLVSDGVLRAVTLTEDGGRVVAGTLSLDGRAWTSSEHLAYDKGYTWGGFATDAGGAQIPVAGTLRTLAPRQIMEAEFSQADNTVVGIATPIMLQFAGHVSDRAAVQRALRVHTSTPTEGSWAWLPDTADGSRVHWRPQRYWQPGTVVDVTSPLFGVSFGDGVYGQQDLTSHFTIGRSQIVQADVTSHRMVVYRDEAKVLDVPASYGLGSDPNRNTRGGTHVVMSKEPDKSMSNPAYGYFDVHVEWAVRIDNNGEFIHSNPATLNAQGQENVTHGCVNLSTPNAKAYYDTALYGDPVEVTGSAIPLSATDGDIYDWTMTFAQWQAMSALPLPPLVTTLTGPGRP